MLQVQGAYMSSGVLIIENGIYSGPEGRNPIFESTDNRKQHLAPVSDEGLRQGS